MAGQKFIYDWQRLGERNSRLRFHIFRFNGSKVMAKVEVLCDEQKA